MDRHTWRGPLIVSLAAWLLCGSAALAEPVAVPQAMKAAEGFLKERIVPTGPGAKEGLQALVAVTAALAEVREIRDRAGTVVAYVVDLEPAGFVVLSADTDIAPVVAYSFKNPFPSGADPRNPLYRMLREDMRLRLEALAEHPELKDPQAARLWEAYGRGEIRVAAEPVQQWPPAGATSTGGWVETTWVQDEPYNQLCPLDPSDGLRSVVGCVATALAQVVNYHCVCDVALDEFDAYKMYSGVEMDADSELYDFPSFAELNEYLKEVTRKYSEGIDLNDLDAAALSFACGLLVQMDYASDGSGAPTYAAQAAFLERFGFYSADMYGALFGDGLTVLQENVMNGAPALLSFSPPDGYGGHLIVCDGYNSEGEWHYNYGWGSERPQGITEAWYRAPMGLLYRDCVFSECVLNVHLAQPVLETDPVSLSFYGAPGQESAAQTLRIENSVANVTIDSIVCPDGFKISRLGKPYGTGLESFKLDRPRQGASINVKFSPTQAGGYHGPLTIHYSDGSVKYVVLKGWAFEGGATVAPGSVSGTWSLDKSPYTVTGDIRVAKNGKLVIEPGVKVLFAGPYGLTVGENATLIARGNEARPIEFTAWNTEAGWTGLRFLDSGADDRLSFCSISHVRKGLGLIPEDEDEPAGADTRGGALYCAGSDPIVENCRITNNMGDVGGAIYTIGGYPMILNCLIANNASLGGDPRCGGICSDDSGLTEIRNCTIVNNFPGGIFGASVDGIVVTNCLIWGNERYQVQMNRCTPEVTFCNVQGGFPGEGNLNADPCFFDPAEGFGLDYDGAAANWALRPSSPCINAGTPMDDLPQFDLAGGERVHGELIDIGACENQSDLPVMTLMPATVDAGFVSVGASDIVVLELVNTGALDFAVNSVAVSDITGAFSLLSPVENAVLAPGDSVQVDIKFSPTREGRYAGALAIQSTSSNAATARVNLHGVGFTGTPAGPGSVSGTWKKANSPYTVTGDIRIPRGRTLTIEPGVVVRFAGRFGLTVGYRGTLRAAGTEQEKIVFTAVDPDEGWGGIRFINSGSDDVLKHCTIEYGRKLRTDGGEIEALYGGAVLCTVSDTEEPGAPIPSSPTIDSCLIRHNEGVTGGGIMCFYESEAVITNNVIVENDAGMDGGGIALYASGCQVANNVIARNYAMIGGGIMNFLGAPSITNNTIVGNKPSAMHLESASMFLWEPETASVLNNIVWHNEIYMEEYVEPEEYDIRFNNIQGGWDGEGNLSVDPLFADAAHDDYHLKSQAGRWDPATGEWVIDEVTSPCIDAGDPAGDAADEPQPNGERIDLGAYGGTGQASKTPPAPDGP